MEDKDLYEIEELVMDLSCRCAAWDENCIAWLFRRLIVRLCLRNGVRPETLRTELLAAIDTAQRLMAMDEKNDQNTNGGGGAGTMVEIASCGPTAGKLADPKPISDAEQRSLESRFPVFQNPGRYVEEHQIPFKMTP